MVDETKLKPIKDMLGYTEAQWETWKSNPRNLRIVENAADKISKYKLLFEVKSSTGCAAGHKVGDKIVFDGGGCLLSKESPEKICCGLLPQMSQFAWAVLDKICDGEDPTKMAFSRVHCTDVGVDHGGWGEVVIEANVEMI